MTQQTLEYYENNAEAFINGTINVEFSQLQNEFTRLLEPGTTIIDLGCGSGRDSKAFMDLKFRVIAVDGSPALAKSASEYLGQEVICQTFQDYEPDEMVGGIWACASLLHLRSDEISPVIAKLTRHLKSGGCFYASFKYGDFEGFRNGRYFTNLDEARFRELLADIPKLHIVKEFITVDARPGRDDENWLNVLMVKE